MRRIVPHSIPYPTYKYRTVDPHGSASLWHQSGKLDPDPQQIGKQDPDSHQSEKVEALKGHFKALEGPNLGKKLVIGSATV